MKVHFIFYLSSSIQSLCMFLYVAKWSLACVYTNRIVRKCMCMYVFCDLVTCMFIVYICYLNAINYYNSSIR